MLRTALIAALSLALGGAKSPPWLSIESPVNPYDADTRGDLLLVHASFREGVPQLADVTGTAEGLVNGVRRSVPLRFEATSRPTVFGLKRQWPTDGVWMLRIALKQTTALVQLDRAGSVASAVVPTRMQSGIPLPREIGAREIDSTLAATSRR